MLNRLISKLLLGRIFFLLFKNSLYDFYDSALGLEIAPKVRFIKKGQKQEQSANDDNKSLAEGKINDDNHKPENKDTEDEEDDEEDWFTVKRTSDTLEQATIDLPEPVEKGKKISKAKLAKKLRKKNLLVNKRVEYDEEGNVSSMITLS